ncbi:phage minor tail U family protein [Hafnia paralvei]|uniref:phage minor tail U family protein n=1 Tax=Hafnia paralvei TaxID=546367 RepID=UPI00103502F6|nr:phage minor tail U family protein [Hafnia paralvei]TBL58188.1 phage tail protein [Hafnia paralvei]
MNKHSEIRKAILDRIKAIDDSKTTYFDGRPGFIDASDLPAVAVYLTEAQCVCSELDSDTWEANLHVEVFLKAAQPDSALDEWMERRIYPALQDIPALASLIRTITPLGYEYQRDNDMVTWGSADLTYTLTYDM